ncbi:hypothetical protein MTO96_006391 [Rhipicephalus appendiculatus]
MLRDFHAFYEPLSCWVWKRSSGPKYLALLSSPDVSLAGRFGEVFSEKTSLFLHTQADDFEEEEEESEEENGVVCQTVWRTEEQNARTTTKR